MACLKEETNGCTWYARGTEEVTLNALTYVDVLRQELVGHFVLVENVFVDASAGEGGAEEEADKSSRK